MKDMLCGFSVGDRVKLNYHEDRFPPWVGLGVVESIGVGLNNEYLSIKMDNGSTGGFKPDCLVHCAQSDKELADEYRRLRKESADLMTKAIFISGILNRKGWALRARKCNLFEFFRKAEEVI